MAFHISEADNFVSTNNVWIFFSLLTSFFTTDVFLFAYDGLENKYEI